MKFNHPSKNASILSTICFITIFILFWNLKMQDNLIKKDATRENVAKEMFRTMIFPRGGDDVIFDQPWGLVKQKIVKNFSELDTSRKFIVSNFSYSPGIGNLMFQYASLRVLAEKNDAFLVVPDSCLLRRAFGQFSHVKFMESDGVKKFLFENFRQGYSYDDCCKVLDDIRIFSYKPIEIINGYFQSYLNFHPEYENLIRKEFRFLNEVQHAAEQILEEAKFSRLRNESFVKFDQNDEQNDAVINIPVGIDENYIFIGIHVRHGLDVTFHSRNLNHGHLAAPPSYYFQAIEYFRKKFPENKLIFLVSSDAILWAKNIFKRITNEVSIFYIESGYREIDLAALALCNHSIISTGTFSWWAGYLSGGEVVYYKDWPKDGSTMAKMIAKKKYFLNNWIGL